MTLLKRLLGWTKRHKRPLAIVVLVTTFGLLGWYLAVNPQVLDRLVQTNPWTLLGLFVLYGVVVATNVYMVYASVKLCRKHLSLKNSAFLSVYSSIVNFFGPLQSGPGVRAVYLKTKLGLKIRNYTLAMLFYYFLFAAISSSLLFATTVPVLSVLGVVAGTVLVAYGARRFGFSSHTLVIVGIYIATVIQVVVTALIYHLELHATGNPVSFLQSLSYAGSANLALFVSLTPGAIGIRETFLLFTQSLHGVSTSAIVAAGILDRAFYVVFLVLLFVGSSAFHVRDALQLKKRS